MRYLSYKYIFNSNKEMSNIHVLVDAKKEYTTQLVNILTPRMLEGFQSVYDQAKKVGEKTNNTQILKLFQTYLSDIPKWDSNTLNSEYNRIKNQSNCEWINDLIKAVFVSHTKVLISIRKNAYSKGSVNLSIPKGEFFIHRCYINIARQMWKKPYLFYHVVTKYESQQHHTEIEKIISSTIEETVRKLLPVQNILKEYLGNDIEDNLDDDFSKNISTSESENLKKLVKKELEISVTKNDITNDEYDNFEMSSNAINTNKTTLDEKNVAQELSENKLDTLSNVDAVSVNETATIDEVQPDTQSNKDTSSVNKTSTVDDAQLDTQSNVDTSSVNKTTVVDEAQLDTQSNVDAVSVNETATVDEVQLDTQSNVDAVKETDSLNKLGGNLDTDSRISNNILEDLLHDNESLNIDNLNKYLYEGMDDTTSIQKNAINSEKVITNTETLMESNLEDLTTKETLIESKTDDDTPTDTLTEMNTENAITKVENLTKTNTDEVLSTKTLTESKPEEVTPTETLTETNTEEVTPTETLTESKSEEVSLTEKLIESTPDKVSLGDSKTEEAQSLHIIDTTLSEENKLQENLDHNVDKDNEQEDTLTHETSIYELNNEEKMINEYYLNNLDEILVNKEDKSDNNYEKQTIEEYYLNNIYNKNNSEDELINEQEEIEINSYHNEEIKKDITKNIKLEIDSNLDNKSEQSNILFSDAINF